MSLHCSVLLTMSKNQGMRCLAVSPRTFSPFYACRRFAFRRLAVNLLAPLWADSEFTGRLRIKLPCDWQILSLLKSANARSGSETEHAINLPAIVSFAAQIFLHLPDIVPLHDRWHFFAEVGSRRGRSRVWSSRDHRRQQ